MFLINYIMCSSELRGSWDVAQWWRGWLSPYPGPRMQKKKAKARSRKHRDGCIYIYGCENICIQLLSVKTEGYSSWVLGRKQE